MRLDRVFILLGLVFISITVIVVTSIPTFQEWKLIMDDDKFPFVAGYRGATFDGESVYFAPYYNNYDRKHGLMIKYDTSLPFNDPNSWKTHSMTQFGIGGFQGALYHNDFVYYVPYYFEPNSDSKFLRYNTNMEFNDVNAWENIGIFDVGAFEDGVVAKNFIYFSPHIDQNDERNALPLRYDTTKNFEDINTYEQYDSGLKVSFIGASFDGELVYYAPFASDYHDKSIILIYDTKKEFSESDAWKELEIPYAQYSGIGFDGERMIIAPHCYDNDDEIPICPKILFLDTKTHEVSFSNESYGSYDGVIETEKGMFLVPDAYGTGKRADFLMIKDEIYSYSPSIAKGGYWGGTYDGQFVYYAPYSFPNSDIRNGEFLRYDTTKNFNDESAWEIISIKITDIELNFIWGD